MIAHPWTQYIHIRKYGTIQLNSFMLLPLWLTSNSCRLAKLAMSGDSLVIILSLSDNLRNPVRL